MSDEKGENSFVAWVMPQRQAREERMLRILHHGFHGDPALSREELKKAKTALSQVIVKRAETLPLHLTYGVHGLQTEPKEQPSSSAKNSRRIPKTPHHG